MLRFLADENFHGAIVRGLRRRRPGIDLVTVPDAGLVGADDPAVLAWAAGEGRVLLTHDVSTVKPFAYRRVADGLPMPGVLEVPSGLAIGVAIEEILYVAECAFEGELECRVLRLPL